MIGDWVVFPHGCDRVQELSYIPGHGHCASFAASATLFPVEVDKLKPIPLTPEILEKNGFKQVDMGGEICIIGEYLWGDEGKRNFTIVRITFYKGLNSGVNLLTKIETDCSHESGINMIHSCDIEYVHQLQHALRLCGIEKEIIL